MGFVATRWRTWRRSATRPWAALKCAAKPGAGLPHAFGRALGTTGCRAVCATNGSTGAVYERPEARGIRRSPNRPYADRMAGRGGSGQGRAEWSALREWNDGGVAAVGAERPSANRHVAQPPARLFDLGRQEALGLLVDADDVADQVAGTVLVDGVELLLDCFGFGEQPLALLEQPVEAIQVVGGDGVALRQRGAADRLVQANAERDWPDLGRWRVELLDQGGTPLSGGLGRVIGRFLHAL